MARIVVGLDGGGTRTRGICVDLDGAVLARFEGGGANPRHEPDASTHVKDVIRGVVRSAACTLDEVECLVAGLAGLDADSDLDWAEELTQVPGLACPRVHVNDAQAAHAGAFAGGPGIVLISGTGAIVWGRDEARRSIRDYDFDYYTYSAARFLGYHAIHAILSGETGYDDEELTQAALSHFGVANVAGLRARSATRHERSTRDENRLHGAFAPEVTKAAHGGGPLARRICDAAAARMVTGIRLVASTFDTSTVPVALVGAVARHPYFEAKLHELLSTANACPPSIVLCAALMSPEAGSALLALQRLGIELEGPVRRLLAEHDRA